MLSARLFRVASTFATPRSDLAACSALASLDVTRTRWDVRWCVGASLLAGAIARGSDRSYMDSNTGIFNSGRTGVWMDLNVRAILDPSRGRAVSSTCYARASSSNAPCSSIQHRYLVRT